MANTLPMEGDQLPKFRKSPLNVLGMLNLVRSARTKERGLFLFDQSFITSSCETVERVLRTCFEERVDVIGPEPRPV